MFDFMQMMQFGRETKAHGETWLVLHALQNRCSLAIKPGDTFPCPVYLIQEPEKEKPTEGREG